MADSTDRIGILREVRASSGELVRAYDMKADIGMICFILSAEVIHAFMDFEKLRLSHPKSAILLFVMFVATVLSYMAVLFPAFKTTAAATSYQPRNVFFVPDPSRTSVEAYIQSIDSADLEKEAAVDIFKLAAIRNSKHARFVVALCLTIAFYLVALLIGLRL